MDKQCTYYDKAKYDPDYKYKAKDSDEASASADSAVLDTKEAEEILNAIYSRLKVFNLKRKQHGKMEMMSSEKINNIPSTIVILDTITNINAIKSKQINTDLFTLCRDNPMIHDLPIQEGQEILVIKNENSSNSHIALIVAGEIAIYKRRSSVVRTLVTVIILS